MVSKISLFLLECLYEQMECRFNGICTRENTCLCLFNCTEYDEAEAIQDEITEEWYPNQCYYDQVKCNLYYRKSKYSL